jgi:hypothetical protein
MIKIAHLLDSGDQDRRKRVRLEHQGAGCRYEFVSERNGQNSSHNEESASS